MQEILLVIAMMFGGQLIGSLIGLVKKPSDRLLHSSLAFAGSMMLALSFFELLPQSLSIAAGWLVLVFFLSGIVVFKALDHLIPHVHPEFLKIEHRCTKRSVDMLVLGIALHNIPEGLAVGTCFAIDPSMGLLIALAISIQDIPENLAMVVPLYCLNHSRLRSFMIVLGTVFFELAGFIIGYAFLTGASLPLVGASLAMAAGLMTYISLDELLPAAELRQRPKAGAIAIILGVASVLLLGMISF